MSHYQDDHPSREILSAFAEGRSAGVNLADLEQHVAGCEECAATIETLDSDCDLGRRVGAAVNQQPAAPASDQLLSFLEPTSRPDALGRIGHYDVLEVLGRGGFGIVLKAFDDSLQRVVALKVLAPELAVTSPARQRFLREARAAAAVRHENVVQIYSVSEQPLPYLVMEFIPGDNLQQRLDRTGPLDATEVATIGCQIAAGLAAAHSQGLIHRDIKPCNIMLDSTLAAKVKITDFGLARAVDDASLTQSGVVAGTPMFMAPEQARGEALDHRSDLFSLGSVLYAILSGRPPFRAANTVAVLRRVCDDTPRPIEEIIADAPRWLCQIIDRLHEKRPQERIQTAVEVATLLCPLAVERANVQSRLRHIAVKSGTDDKRSTFWIAGSVACAIVLFGVISQFGTFAQNRPRRQGLTVQPAKLMTKSVSPVTNQVSSSKSIHQPTFALNPSVRPRPDGQALRFDGRSSYAHVASLSRTDSGPATLEAWVRPEYQPAAQVVALISGDSLLQITKRDEFLFPIEAYSPMCPLPGSPTYLVAEWVHVATVVDQSEVRFYLNGKKRLQIARQDDPVQTRYPYDGLWLGGSPGDKALDQTCFHFRGLLDEIRISSTARYREDFTPATRFNPDAQTLALYHCDEGTGSELRDSSGHNQHGKLTDTQWSDQAQEAEIASTLVLNDKCLKRTASFGPAEWQIKDGQLVGGTEAQETSMLRVGHYLPPRFRLTCEALVTGNSGIYVEVFSAEGQQKSYHVEWWGRASGGIADGNPWQWLIEHESPTSTDGVWTTVELLVDDTSLTSFVNGEKIATVPIPAHVRADLKLELDAQNGPSNLQVRKLEMRPF